MKRFTSLLAVLCCPMLVFCQDLTGLWKGTLYNDSTQQSLEYEIVISRDKGKYTGFSHTWFLINEKKYYGIKKIRVHVAKDGKIIIQDADLVGHNYPIVANKNVRQLNVLALSKIGDETLLEGPFITNRTKEYKELTGHINVKRVSLLSQSDLLLYLQENKGDNSLTMAR